MRKGVFTLSRRAALTSALGAPALASCAHGASQAESDGAFKCTEFIRRAPALDRAAFLDIWLSERAPLLEQLPGLTGLVFNLVDHARSPSTRFDAAIEYWFVSEAAYHSAMNSAPPEITAPLIDKAASFMQPDVMALYTREAAIRQQTPGRQTPRAKRIGLVGRLPQTPQDTFFREWIDIHAPPVDRQPGLERYVLNLLSKDRSPHTPWDGYAALWWTDWDAYENARAVVRQGLEERLAFFHSHELLLVDEHIARAPPLA